MAPLNPRVICSTITLRHLPLRDALASISAAGFVGIDLGALPGVCDHVPFTLDADAVTEVAAVVQTSGLAVRSVNADVGDLNSPLDATVDAERLTHLDRLLDLCTAIDAQALVLPNGAQDHDPVDDLERDLDRVAGRLAEHARRAHDRGVQLWVEAPHFFRLVYDLDRTALLLDRLPESIGVVCDTSHITASGSTPREFLARFGERTHHVHLRDAEPGYIHHSIGRGVIDFADLVDALSEIGYTGDLSLELETRDVANDDRAETALQAAQFISSLLAAPRAAADTTN
jgi:sugar phosphate isomerase/epimerase